MSIINSKIKNLKYAEFSNIGDHQLKLISSLLLKVNDSLEESELQALGEVMFSYLNNKIVLDHVFWDRPLTLCGFDDEELEQAIIRIKNNMVSIR